ncbi:MAG: hypothetical protein ABMA64_38050 [Myxococcota bacterium]
MLTWLAACNRYDLFLIEDGRGGSVEDVDLLFVIDNSDSMVEESLALAENFGQFVTALVAREDGYGTDGLPDAVDRYADSMANPGWFVDFQLAITTIDASDSQGALAGPVLAKGDPGLTDAFVQQLMCGSACFSSRSLVPSDDAFQCGDPFDGEVTQELLDCLCGPDAWVGQCGGGAEQGLEAVFDAMCRAVDDPPDACFDEDGIPPAVVGTNAGLVRPGATLIPVVVTDEGDGSARVPRVDAVPQAYFNLFGELDVPMTWVVVSPALNEDAELVCPSAAFSWGLQRYQYLVDATGGLHVDLHDASCGPANWADALAQIGDLVSRGSRAFLLPRPAVPASIAVEVGGRGIEESVRRGEDPFGQPLYTDGWSYDEVQQSVLLRGEAVPGPEDRVLIWYQPRRGK